MPDFNAAIAALAADWIIYLSAVLLLSPTAVLFWALADALRK